MSIHFNGQEYASLEAMPAEVREVYEEFIQDPDLARSIGAEPSTPAGLPPARPQTLPPAWGGARPGSGVPVPVDFDGVSELGPATAVYEPQGLHLPHLGTAHATALVVYRDGFAYQAGSKDTHAWRFEEVAVIQSNLAWPPHSAETHEYTLTRTSGEALILDDGVKSITAAADKIKDAVFARLGPALIQRYQAGEALTFGPVTVQQQTGLRLGGQHYAWGDIQNIQVQNGRFQLSLRNGKHGEARASAIPNIELLGQLIGIDPIQMQLVYIV
jgi:hypothetical protein